MESDVRNPQIEVFNVENHNFLRFSFKGTLAEGDAKKAILEWKRVFNLRYGEKFILVWDCNQMTGYDPGARIVWQNTLKEMRDQVSNIWVISSSTMIRSAVMIISMITNYKIKVVQSESEIDISMLQLEPEAV